MIGRGSFLGHPFSWPARRALKLSLNRFLPNFPKLAFYLRLLFKISTNCFLVPHSRFVSAYQRRTFPWILHKFLLETSKRLTYAAMWHRRSISRYINPKSWHIFSPKMTAGFVARNRRSRDPWWPSQISTAKFRRLSQ